MTYKVLLLVAPLTIASIVDLPSKLSFDHPNAISSAFTFLPISFDDSYLNSGFLYTDYFNCDTYGPFSLNTVTNSTNVTFTYEYYTFASQNIIERVRLLNTSGAVLYGSSKASRSYQKGTRNDVTFTLPLKDYFTNNGLTLKFEILKQSDRSILKAYTTTFYPPSNSTISSVNLKQSPHVSNSLGFYGDGSGLNNLIETLDFTQFGDYLDIDNYYRLDIGKNLIAYPNDCPFRFNKASLKFNDSEQLFPYCNHDSFGDVNIPLKMVKTQNAIQLQFKNSFYINKRTLQVSNSYRSGFVLTKDFYLPINGRSKFNGKQLYFILEGFGLDNITTTIPLKYDASKSLVGVCSDGDYCVIGGTR